MKPDMGIYYDMLDKVATKEPSLSFLTKSWPNVDVWKKQARSKVSELLAFDPQNTPLDPRIESRKQNDGVTQEEVSYAMPYGPRTHAFFLYPQESRNGKLPAIIGLHDHGSFFYFGKEKITAIPHEPTILTEFKQKYYGARNWASELAKRGFAVLVVDVFLWGTRRIPLDTVNQEFQKCFDGVEPGSDEYIRRYNEFWEINECMLIVDSILDAGTSWPGIFSYEDRRSIDYLLDRPEIDPTKIGCGGLSGGGLRSVFLAGLDARIRCGFSVGFMSTIRGILRNHIRCPPGHGLLMYVPQLFHFLDLPDIIALHAPAPLMVQYNTEDELFTIQGQREADEKISAVYSKIGSPRNYVGRFYPGGHKFDVAMQEEVFRWLEEHLVR
jgi:dienelactone hydrolase